MMGDYLVTVEVKGVGTAEDACALAEDRVLDAIEESGTTGKIGDSGVAYEPTVDGFTVVYTVDTVVNSDDPDFMDRIEPEVSVVEEV